MASEDFIRALVGRYIQDLCIGSVQIGSDSFFLIIPHNYEGNEPGDVSFSKAQQSKGFQMTVGLRSSGCGICWLKGVCRNI